MKNIDEKLNRLDSIDSELSSLRGRIAEFSDEERGRFLELTEQSKQLVSEIEQETGLCVNRPMASLPSNVGAPRLPTDYDRLSAIRELIGQIDDEAVKIALYEAWKEKAEQVFPEALQCESRATALRRSLKRRAAAA